MATGTVTGGREVRAALRIEAADIKRGGRVGLLRAGLYIEGEAKRGAPIDTGNLRASGYSRMAQGGGLAVEVGFTAKYALWVHEMVEQKLKGQPRSDFGTTRDGVSFGGGSGKGHYWDGGGPKFLEKALQNEDQILRLIASGAKIK